MPDFFDKWIQQSPENQKAYWEESIKVMEDEIRARDAEVERLRAQVDYLEQVATGLREETQKAEDEAGRLRADAERYRYLKSLLIGANFAHEQASGPVLEFELPEGLRVSADLDATLDAARCE